IGELNYIWQLYLPRLPGTASDFPGLFTTKQLWFNGFVGLYGWLDTPFPSWVYSWALVLALAFALALGRSLLQVRADLRQRALELLGYAVMAVGLTLLIGAASFQAFPGTDGEYGHARYFMQLLPLLAAAIALDVPRAG